MKYTTNILFGCLLSCFAFGIQAQEFTMPLRYNPAYSKAGIKAHQSEKKRAILPFVDDFSYQGPYPDATLWTDNKAYINNTMSADPVTRGVATLDGLNQFGRPYYADQLGSGFADSLTSVSIDLSTYGPLDSIYLSFYYQPQGLGFAPEAKDSLFLYFKNNLNQWVRMWETKGTPYQGFKIAVLPVMDIQFLHGSFQFRFVNLASLNINDDVWNLDYIKLDDQRDEFDTVMNDIAFTIEPGSILSNYSTMPYRHFIVNQAGEKSVSHDLYIGNNYPVSHSVSVTLESSELLSGSPIHSATLSPVTIAAKGIMQFNFSSFNIAYVPPTTKSKVLIRNRYYYAPVNAGDRTMNDTIVRDVEMDNYFAYDDGSVEKSYFLLPAVNYPAKTALQFTLNEPDTIRGMMVHFGAQAPTASGKYFSIVVYKSLGALGVGDSIILQEDLFRVLYEPSYNGFTSYAFQLPKRLDAGTYYIGITQPANFGSDSIYYGLDVNRNTNAQYLSYNVDGTWYSSTINGSVMMRPIVGQDFVPTGVKDVDQNNLPELLLFPNPAADEVFIKSDMAFIQCQIISMDGKLIDKRLLNENRLVIDDLHTGLYILRFSDIKGRFISKLLNKQ